jgi:4-hydroxy-4-methyl-2-oxoglutarate aldolase
LSPVFSDLHRSDLRCFGRNGASRAWIAEFDSRFGTLHHSCAGRALTVEGEPAQSSDPDEIFLPLLRMLGDVTPGDVIVTQPHESSCAHIGELSCETAKLRGVRGVVIDGEARDIDYILKLNVAVFCRYRTPLDILGRWKLNVLQPPHTNW